MRTRDQAHLGKGVQLDHQLRCQGILGFIAGERHPTLDPNTDIARRVHERRLQHMLNVTLSFQEESTEVIPWLKHLLPPS